MTPTGSSIVAPDAAPWVTDFLNAAYYRRRDKDLDDLRLAWTTLTTRWFQLGRRLHAHDLPAFAKAYRRAFGTLDHAQLLEGAARLLGAWFADAWADPARRGWGIAFEGSPDDYDPTSRLKDAALGALTPPAADDLVWHTYPPVPCDGPRVLEALTRARDWPEFGSALGRFTALRPGPTAPGQTFEIDVMATTVPGVPVATRGYVTVTRLETGGAVDTSTLGVPLDREPIALIALTTHEEHFLGRAISHLLVFDDAIQDVGCWDPLTPYLKATYAIAGRAAQNRFWGPDDPQGSMLRALAAYA